MENNYWIEQLYNNYRHLLFNIAKNLCWDEVQAEDFVQDTFMLLLELKIPLKNMDHTRALAITIVRRRAMLWLNHKGVVRTRADAVSSIVMNWSSDKSDVSFDYYPYDTKAVEELMQLNSNHRDAVVAYMYGIPLNELGRAAANAPQRGHEWFTTAILRIRSKLFTGMTTDQLRSRKLSKAKLSDKGKQIIGLHYTGVRSADIARELKVTPATVYKCLKNHRIQLAKELPTPQQVS